MNRTGAPRSILYVITDDWFFVSHFLPLGLTAQRAGHKITIACRAGPAVEKLRAAGFDVIDTVEAREGGLMASLRLIRKYASIFRALKPDLVHFIALRPIVIAGLAHRLRFRGSSRVLAVTGLGYLDAKAASGWKRRLIFAAVRLAGGGRRARFLFENRQDPNTLELRDEAVRNACYVGGAGVDTDLLKPVAIGRSGPLRLAMIARMIWSKGADTAIAAVRRAREAGHDVSLSLYGEPDIGNPASLDADFLKQLDGRDGIAWHGRTDDVAAVWAKHHACILPSRGGEGLPRTLLEAAACGRAIITTNVPGCADFVRDGVEGMVVPPDDAEALTSVIIALAHDRERLEMMGRNARKRVEDGYTIEAVTGRIMALYAQLLS